jgi:uncharacterized membrane protein YkgB
MQSAARRAAIRQDEVTPITPRRVERLAPVLERSGEYVLRGGLVLVILWFGIFKFTPTEAEAIRPLLTYSPLLHWLYAVLDVPDASRAIGTIEIAIALLIAARPWFPRASAIGSIGAVGMFLTTLSFLATTPGMWATVDGLLVPAGAGGFILKDVLLLGAALYTAGEALRQWREGTVRD